ncbi:MAG TPA: tRNA lysidine(34) synthetase TilS [Myxococcales bacterium]|nr:tRNA lysidine(34) synthetase TilS [Myxococcales bacterium]HAN30485.1 tRNA lysidine(34) synthetase TilS [Myxococcales bacterium]
MSSRTRRKLLAHVRNQVRDFGLWGEQDRILLACSGGLDSMATAAVLEALRPSLGHELVLGHVDHGLQPNGPALAVITQWGERAEIPVMVDRLTLKMGSDLQGRAREARYAALQQMMEKSNANRIVTAHHADDQAETFLMRASRGAGLEGLSAIRRRRGHVVRPMLTTTRTALLDFATAQGLSWWQDPSNSDPRWTRNRIRNEVMERLQQAIPSAISGIGQSASQMSSVQVGVEYWLRHAIGPWDKRGAAIGIALKHVPDQIEAASLVFQLMIKDLDLVALSSRALRQLHQIKRDGQNCRLHGAKASIQDGILWVEATDADRSKSS